MLGLQLATLTVGSQRRCASLLIRRDGGDASDYSTNEYICGDRDITIYKLWFLRRDVLLLLL